MYDGPVIALSQSSVCALGMGTNCQGFRAYAPSVHLEVPLDYFAVLLEYLMFLSQSMKCDDWIIYSNPVGNI